MTELMPIWFILPAACAVDLVIGDPPRLPHPVRWMGRAIIACEPAFRKLSRNLVVAGTLYALMLVSAAWLFTFGMLEFTGWIHPLLRSAVEVVLIFFCLSARSLEQAAMEIYDCLVENDVDQARRNVAFVVGRDVSAYGKEGIARATVETVAENLVDGFIAPLFFAVVGGAPMAVAYKMINTLDSMVGYKNERYHQFGKASARIDDLFNYIPARLSIPVIAVASQFLSGRGRQGFKTAVTEGANHSSPNAGFAEAAFAGTLAVKLNGPNIYHGKRVEKPYIGIRFGCASPRHIKKACDLMLLSSFLWLILMVATGVILSYIS